MSSSRMLNSRNTMKRKPIAAESGSTILVLPGISSRATSASSRAARSITNADLFKIRLANVTGIRSEANLLVKKRYEERGYTTQDIEPNPYRLTIVAYDGKEPTGTISIGFDSSKGLLCDELYKVDVDKLRGTRRKVCEFIKLAVNSPSASIPTLAALFHVAFLYAYKIYRFDDIVMEINPHHAKFYTRALGFQQIGAEMLNSRVNAPALLLRCECSYINAQLEKFGGRIEARNHEKSIYPYGLSREEEQEILQRLIKLHAVKQKDSES